MGIIFFYILAYIAILSFINLLVYWKQLKSKILSKKLGEKAFRVWLIADILFIIVTSIFLLYFIIFYNHPQIYIKKIIVQVLGIILFIAGVLLSVAAVNRIGWARSFSLSIFTRGKYTQQRDGVFRFLQHPMYLGWFLIFLGITLFLNSLYLLCFTMEGGLYFIIRSKLEEKELDLL